MTEITAASPHKAATHQFIPPVNNGRTEIDDLDAAIGKLSRDMNASNYRLMVLIREFDERAGWLKWGFEKGLPWLLWRCDLSANAARDKLRVAHALKDLPAISVGATDGTGENIGASELPIETVRRLCCDGSVVPIVENNKGEPLSVGR